MLPQDTAAAQSQRQGRGDGVAQLLRLRICPGGWLRQAVDLQDGHGPVAVLPVGEQVLGDPADRVPVEQAGDRVPPALPVDGGLQQAAGVQTDQIDKEADMAVGGPFRQIQHVADPADAASAVCPPVLRAQPVPAGPEQPEQLLPVEMGRELLLLPGAEDLLPLQLQDL